MNSSKWLRNFEELDKPTHEDDLQDIWKGIRFLLSGIRILILASIIIIAEVFNEVMVHSLSLAVWSIIVGLPLFIAVSIIILAGDSAYAADGSSIEPV